MAAYLQDKTKFLKYRVIAEVDQRTNDFPRNEKGEIETDDLYIKCQHGNKIYSYGHGTLVAYVPSTVRCRNILSQLDKLNEKIYFEERFYDKEAEFKFKAKHIDIVAELLGAQNSPKNRDGEYHYISPFSTKNIPKIKVTIPNDKLREYANSISNLGSNSMLIAKDVTKAYLNSIVNKKYTQDILDADMQKTGLKTKEFLYYTGRFDEFIEFINNYKGEF